MSGPDDLGRPAATPDRDVHLVGNAHLDPVWLWPWTEGHQEARATFASALQRMEEYPDFVFTCDQVVLLSWVEEADSDLFDQIRQRVAEGRWVNVGGWWVEPDCNLALGESYVRQGLHGQRFLLSRFGQCASVGMNVDPFGHNVALPQVLRGQGMDSYVFLRPGPHESDLAETLFWWEAPDGSRVLAYRVPHEYHSPAGGVDAHLDSALAAAQRGLDPLMVFYGVGDHGGGPTRANIESIHRYDAEGTFGRLQLSSPRAYLDQVLADEALVGSLPVRRNDLQHHARGCYSAHSGVKAWQWRAQHALLVAERWAAVATAVEGAAHPRSELDTAWKQVLFNQFHDVLPGSAIAVAYDDARDQLGEATAIARRITVRSQAVLARQVATDGIQADPLLVFNPHPWQVRSTVVVEFRDRPGGVHVVDAAGAALPVQDVQTAGTRADREHGALLVPVDLPALGYRLLGLADGPPDAPARSEGHLDVGPSHLENDELRVEIDLATGWLSSLLDRRTGVDLVAGTDPAQHTRVSQDPSDAWGHHVVSYVRPGQPMTLRRITVREHGPLRARLRVERTWGRSVLIEELVLERGSRALRVEVLLDWREQLHLLKLRVPLALDRPQATYGAPFAHATRPVDGAEEPAVGWLDVSGEQGGAAAGLTLVTGAKHGFDVSPEPSVGLTAVRSPVYAWHDPAVLESDGVYQYHDQGEQRFVYELVPHAGDWRSVAPVRRAALLAEPPQAGHEWRHSGVRPSSCSFADDHAGPVLVSALKGAEDPGEGGRARDVVVRLVETEGLPARQQVDVLGRAINVDLGPYELLTLRVPGEPGRPVERLDLLERPTGVLEQDGGP